MAHKENLLSGLLQQTSGIDHEEVLKACNATLKTSPHDIEVLQTKAVALLNLERYDDALRILDHGGQDLQHRTRFEKAYALYKTGELDAAKELSKSILDSIGAKHVEAQACYRSEHFENALNVYEGLLGSDRSRSDNENDLMINKTASIAQLQWVKAHIKESRQHTDIYETAFNTASAMTAIGDVERAMRMLVLAEDKCQQNDDLPEDEKDAEIATIRVQMLYVLVKLGQLDEAAQVASKLSTDKITDAAIAKIANVNLVTATPSKNNPFLERREVDEPSKLSAADRLFTYQASRAQENDLTLDLGAMKPQAVINATTPMLTSTQPTTSEHVNILSTLNASASTQGNPVNHGLQNLLLLIDSRPMDIGLTLTIVQIYVLTKNLGRATNIFERLLTKLSKSTESSHRDIRFAPGLVALQISLYKAQDRKSHVRTTYVEAASYWLRKDDPPIQLLQNAGVSLLESDVEGHRRVAQEIFSVLHTIAPRSAAITAGFIASHASTASEAITEEDLSRLPPVEEQIKDIDVSALEEAEVPTLRSENFARKHTLKEKRKLPTKRHRQSRLPKDHDPNKKLDPERWLPLRDRSYYKQPKKKGKKRDADRDRTQGGIVAEKSVEKENDLIKGSEKAVGTGTGPRSKGKKKGKK